MRQLLTEGVLIGLAAGVITLIASPRLCDFIWREIQSRIVFRFSDLYVFSFRFSPDGWVLAWTTVASVASGMLFSVVGAAHCTKANPHEALQGHVAQWTSNRGKLRVNARDALIAVQVVFSVVLLVNAGLVARGMEGQALDFCIAKRIVSRSAFRGPLITCWARLMSAFPPKAR